MAVDFEPVRLPPYSEGQHVARIQRFSGGGFEGTCYWRSNDSRWHNPLGAKSNLPRVRDKAEVALDKARRARRRVRHLVREIAADHLLTLTTREKANEPGALLRRFERFAELYRKALAGRPFLYVAVPEPHPSNPAHWHVHVAVRGRINVNVARGIWWALCGGRGQGNVDARFIKCRSGLDRSVRIARYLGKYVTKSFADRAELDGSHRYRASRVTLERRSVLVFEAGSLNEAVSLLLERLRLSRGDVDVVFFSDFSGFWFSCSGDVAEIEPPF